MKCWTLTLVLFTALALTAGAGESAAPVVPANSADSAALVDSVDALDPSEELEAALKSPAVRPPASAREPVESGAAGVDAEGTAGRIHVVAKGDTLWDIAAAYLRTPWVWPSIWQENSDIADPDRIYPDDHIWISDISMRKVTRAEAAEMIAAESGDSLDESVLTRLGGLAAMAEIAPIPAPDMRRALQSLAVPGVGNMSFLSEDRMTAATSIVSSKSPRTWLLEGDRVVLGLGEGETTKGARYDVFRDAVPVHDFETERIVGYHVEILGWIEITEVHGDSATGMIRSSTSEMMRGDRVIDREEVPVEYALMPAPPGLEGRIIFTPKNRTQMQQLDYVYLNRGAVHGIEVGAEVEVFERGAVLPDHVRGTQVRTPDRRVADMVIVSVQPTTAVGFVVHASRELNIGDTVRPGNAAVAIR